jgi:hypothetical protein
MKICGSVCDIVILMQAVSLPKAVAFFVKGGGGASN